jgi:glucuronate isomerase
MPDFLHPDRLFPADSRIRNIARALYDEVKSVPIISPHGHTEPRWFAEDKNFNNATELLIKPDHYLLRMLYSQGITLEQLGIEGKGNGSAETDPAKIWQVFADNYYLFRGTPTRLWCDYVFAEIFGIEKALGSETAEEYFKLINERLASETFKPRALFEQFNIEVLATTESPLDDLRYHRQIIESDWHGRVITSFRPDPVVDPEVQGFADNIKQLAEITGENVVSFAGYLKALANRRQFFIAHGATATDHGHPSACTADLSVTDCEALYQAALSGNATPEQAELFRAQMLTEMAKMSIDDGLVMQIHPGVYRNHNQSLFEDFGRDKGADIPLKTEYVKALRPLLNKFGNRNDLTIIVFTLDETSYSRELAPLAGHYPALKVGPAWWFHDSPEGMRRYREQITETAGFYNTAGFNDDTRAFLSIPARHDVARRMDCGFLAQLVAEHRMSETEATEIAIDLSYRLAKKAYKL